MKENISKLITISTITLICFACSTSPKNEKEVEFTSFQNTINLTQETVEWLDVYNCGGLVIYDSILVAIDWRRDKIFRVYSLNSKQLIGAFGGYGKGPTEFFNLPSFTSLLYLEGHEIFVQVFDIGRMTIININLTKSVESGNLIVSKQVKIPEESSLSDPFFLNDSIILGSLSELSDVLVTYNLSTGETIKLHTPIQFKQNLSDRFDTYARFMSLTPSLESARIVGAYYFMKRLNIYNMEGDLLMVIKEKGNPVFNTSDPDIYERNKIQFSKAFISNKNILVINENRILKTTDEKYGELCLFDSTGRALNKYILDCYVNNGAVDWKSQRFYTFNRAERTIISYALSGTNW